ncbi:hypothetical protein OH77DRAFT_1416587 [Trametes cingulata]|nr:hypothetical protein OH77DRAFT_1416587 [Trametes cingulata]
MSQSAETLVEERVMQLQEISKRRNELLREMYHLIQRRDNLGSVIAVEEDGEEDLQRFLERFDLEKHPDSGRIENLQDEEVALPVTPPAYSPVIGHEPVKRGSKDASESSVSPPPESPLAAVPSAREKLVFPAPQDADAAMDVDETVVDESSQMPEPAEAPLEQPSHTVSAEPSSANDKAATAPPDGQAEELKGQETQDGTRFLAPTLDGPDTPSRGTSSLESPIPQSIDHSSTVSHTDASGTREPSASQTSPARPQRSPSASLPPREEANVVKAEPLDDEPMEVAEGPLPTQEEPPKDSESPRANELSLQQSEDRIMDILGPSQSVSSPVREDEDHRHSIDYSIPRPPDEPSMDFTFETGITEGLPETDATPVEPFGPEPPYPLPPLSLLPIEFSRRGKSSKRERKRDKEREKGDSKKDEWQPMSLAKWSAVLRANPVHKKLSRATKCLSSREWSVGMTELRLIRTFERIEVLKDAGRWSFRQIKKQRGVGGLTKTHWDYLMDEMKWMRTDFREERRWKLALAYTLAHAVMEWHEAGSLEERVRRGICVLWKPPPPEDADMQETSEHDQADGPFRDSQEGDDTGADSRETGTPLNDYGSDDDSDDEQDKEQQDVIDALEPGTALQDALDQLEEHAHASQGQADGVPLKPKLEEIEDLTALGDNSQGRDENAMDVDSAKAEAPEGAKPEESEAAKAAAAPSDADAHPGLKATSKNPVLGKAATDADGAHGKSKNKANQYAPLRDHIVYSQLDKLFLDLDDLDIVKGMSDLTTDDFSPTAPPPPADLTSIFPDLQPYGMLDVAPPAPTGQDGRKKSDRKADKDDPNKRAEDTTYSKLVPTSKFMQIKPTLLGTLKPARHWKDGKWERIEEAPVFADVDVPPARPIEENLCALFEGSKSSGSAHPTVLPMPGRDGRKRTGDLVWTPADDALLKQMVERYPSNWHLVAEAFNSSRVTISTDRRTPYDCLERWREKTEPRLPAEEENRPSTPTAASVHMTTRGYKRTASQSVAAPSGSSSSGANQSNEPKKRVRHNLMHETLRKAAKRREAVLKSNAAPRAKPTVVHETHGPVTKMTRYTPAELSRMKADKEARDANELFARRQSDQLARQQLLRDQAQRAQGLPPNAQPQPPQAQLLPQAGAANGIPRPPTAVPGAPMVQQIRSQVGISQQQRIAALAANANNRMSPPQLTPAQAAHYRAMAAAQGQGQAQGQVAGQLPGQAGGQGSGQMAQPSSASAALSAAAPALSAAHLSPSFAARATSSSPGLPQQSPPLPAASPANAAVARPPSVPGQPVQGMPMNPMLHAQNVAQYYIQMQQRGALTPEQLQAMVAQIQAQQQQRQAQQQQAQQAQQQQYAAHAQQQSAQQGQNPQNGGYQHT